MIGTTSEYEIRMTISIGIANSYEFTGFVGSTDYNPSLVSMMLSNISSFVLLYPGYTQGDCG